jgi:Ca2+-binding EF-hand superfamily protein
MTTQSAEFIKQKSQELRLPEEKIQMLCDAFDLFDFSGDGNIGAEELYLVYNAIGRTITKAETAAIIAGVEDMKRQQAIEEGKEVDDDGEGEGELDIEEFLTLMSTEIHEEIERKEKDELQEAFERFGIDTKGGPRGLTFQQIASTMDRYTAGSEKLSHEQMELLFESMKNPKYLDNHNNEISFKEFLAFFVSNPNDEK